MFKHKIIKYFLISALILFVLILTAIIRISYKPLDITYFSNSLPPLSKKVSEFYNMKSKNMYLKLNILKNELSLSIDNVFLQNLNSNISDVKAKQAIITFKLSDIIKNKIEVNDITIIQGGLDIYDIKNLSQVNQFENYNKKYTYNSIRFENVNINLYDKNKKLASLANCNLSLIKNKEVVYINDLFIDSLVVKDFDTKNNFTLNDLKLIKKNQSSYTFKINNIEIKNRDFFTKNKYFKNINDVLLKEIIFDYDSNSFLANARGQIHFNDYINSFTVNGSLENFKRFDGDLTINIDSLPIFALLKNNLYDEKKFKINNISSILFNGKLKLIIKESLFEKADIKILSRLNNSDIFITNIKNDLPLKINDISFEGLINKNICEIKSLNINKDNQNLKITGKFYNSFKDFLLNIDADEVRYNKINNFLNNSLDSNLKYFSNISSINIEKIKNIKLIFSKNKNNKELSILNSDFKNLKLKTKNKITLNITSAKIIKKKKNIKLYSSNVFVQGDLGESYFSSLNFFSKDYSDFSNNIEFKSSIKTNYKFLNFILSEFNLTQNFPKSIEGEVSGFLKISKRKKDRVFGYFFEGTLENFNTVKLHNKDMPIALNEFNGKVILSNDIIKIEGIGAINGSSSDIKISVDENNILTASIESQAKVSSFNFLGEYNFLQQGTSKLKILITKDINSRKWKANFNANLFSNEINIDFINFYKPINRRGNISGTLYFDELNILKLEKLDFLTERFLVSSNLQFQEQNRVASIKVDRFIQDKNNFKANIQFIEGEYSQIKIEGESLDLKSFLSFGKEKQRNLTLTLNVTNLYYDNIFFGNTYLESEIKNNQLKNLKGNISNNNAVYIRFKKNIEDQSDFNIINVEFDDFGSFVKRSSLSDSFLEGHGTATLYLKKLNLFKGKLDINSSSIKNSSFLARLLQLASFTGLLEILTNEGIPFDRILVNFTKKGSIVNIEEAKFQGFSLGGNLKGFTEVDNKKLDLEGIIIPAYAINSFLNKIPLIGQVITGIEGDGLIGVNFKVSGNYDKPSYNVNPLSILTPGILRSIFDSLFEINDENKTIE